MNEFRRLTLIRLASADSTFLSAVKESLTPKIKYSGLGISIPKGIIMVPAEPIKPDGSVDIMFQFRGGNISQYEKAGVNAVVVLADSDKPKEFNSSFVNTAVDKILAKLKEVSGKNVKLGKLGFSAFSGGAQAVSNILRSGGIVKKPDFVYIADGAHGGEDVWSKLADEAEKGQTKFILTHTAIVPDGFKSTTEVAEDLLKSRGLSRQPVTNWKSGLKPESVAQKGNFKVVQYHKDNLPYMINGKTNVPGTAGYQHIQAAKDMTTYLTEF